MIKQDSLFKRCVGDSILNSTKKNLGIQPECEEFDVDILLHINAAILTLRQLGVGPKEVFEVVDENDTFQDFLGADSKEIGYVKAYIYYKTRLGFDPPQSSYAADCLKEMIRETECRLSYQVDPNTTFD